MATLQDYEKYGSFPDLCFGFTEGTLVASFHKRTKYYKDVFNFCSMTEVQKLCQEPCHTVGWTQKTLLSERVLVEFPLVSQQEGPFCLCLQNVSWQDH